MADSAETNGDPATDGADHAPERRYQRYTQRMRETLDEASGNRRIFKTIIAFLAFGTLAAAFATGHFMARAVVAGASMTWNLTRAVASLAIYVLTLVGFTTVVLVVGQALHNVATDRWDDRLGVVIVVAYFALLSWLTIKLVRWATAPLVAAFEEGMDEPDADGDDDTDTDADGAGDIDIPDDEQEDVEVMTADD